MTDSDLILDRQRGRRQSIRFPVYAFAVGVLLLVLFLVFPGWLLFLSSAVVMCSGLFHGLRRTSYKRDKLYWSGVVGCAVFLLIYVFVIWMLTQSDSGVPIDFEF